MEISNIMVFIGLHLEKTEIVDVQSTQRYIMKQPGVGKAIDIKDIEMALQLLEYAGFTTSFIYNRNICWKKL